jgi:GT2 family glycosyltransferase
MSKKKPNPLVVIPVFIHREDHIQLLTRCLASLRDPARTSSKVDIVLVDDCSPYEGKTQILNALAGQFDCELVEKEHNTGFSKTANVGLMKAHSRGTAAVLLNMDVEFSPPGVECKNWLKIAMKDEADLVGAKLLYPTGLIQHGGVYYSLLHRYLDHLYRFAPPTMNDANVRAEVPVTGALQVIKPQVFDAVGFYDEHFKMAYEDIDYCLRVMLPPEHGGAGMKVAYNPEVVAVHHESMIRGGQQKYSQWHDESWVYFQQKYARVPMTGLIPPIDRKR